MKTSGAETKNERKQHSWRAVIPIEAGETQKYIFVYSPSTHAFRPRGPTAPNQRQSGGLESGGHVNRTAASLTKTNSQFASLQDKNKVEAFSASVIQSDRGEGEGVGQGKGPRVVFLDLFP
jgi:hypothetical protein